MMFFETKKQLLPDCFDENGYIKPNVVLEQFEDAAAKHAEILGCGFEDMAKKGHLWVIVRTRYEVLANPKANTEIKVKTWPLKPKSVGFRRDYRISDSDDNTLINGTSDWFVINITDRCLAKAEGVYPEDEHLTEEAIVGRVKKVRSYNGEMAEKSVLPTKEDIDKNGHVNNTKYAKFVYDAVDCDLEIKAFQIDYHKEVMPNESFTLSFAKDGNTAYAEGKNKDDESLFLCEIEY